MRHGDLVRHPRAPVVGVGPGPARLPRRGRVRGVATPGRGQRRARRRRLHRGDLRRRGLHAGARATTPWPRSRSCCAATTTRSRAGGPTSSRCGSTGSGGPGAAGELVCHGDPGPWNLVWDLRRPVGQQLVGLIDWEYATVGTRLTDIGYALHYLAPLRDRSYWYGVLGMARKPRRRHRMAVFADAYGVRLDQDLVEAVVAAQQAGVQMMVDLGRARTTASGPAHRPGRARARAPSGGLDRPAPAQVQTLPARPSLRTPEGDKSVEHVF